VNIESKVEDLRDELIESIQRLVKIKSVNEEPSEGKPFGEGIYRTLKEALKIAKNLGFHTENLNGYAGYAQVGEGEDYIGIFGHIDVVPEGEGWIHPPYGGEIHDGKIYGRGVLDDKGPILAALYALKAIVESKAKLSKAVRIVFGTSEESGCKEIPYYLQHEKAPVAGFTPDAGFPLVYAEKGRTTFDLLKTFSKNSEEEVKVISLIGGIKDNMVPDFAQVELKVENIEELELKLNQYIKLTGQKLQLIKNEKKNQIIIKSFGLTAHGGAPHMGKNAIMQLVGFLNSVLSKESELGEYISFLHENIGMETDGQSFSLALKDEVSGELSLNLALIEVNDVNASVTINVRFPVNYKLNEIFSLIQLKLKNTGLKIENPVSIEPLNFPLEHPLVKTLLKVFKDHTGLDEKPLAIGGGTYAGYVPNIVAFGPGLPGKKYIVHQANEALEIEELINLTKIYARAILALAQ